MIKEDPIEFISVRDILRRMNEDWRSIPKWARDKYEKGDIIFLDKGVSVRTNRSGWNDGGLWQYLVLTESGDIYLELEPQFDRIK